MGIVKVHRTINLAIYRIVFAACLVAIGAGSAVADEDWGWAARDYEYASDTLYDFYKRFQWDLVDPVSRSMRQKKAAGASNNSSATARIAPQLDTGIKSVGPPIAPAKLAKGYPQSTRPQAEKFFSQTLETYHGIESQFGLKRNDLAGALAAFVAGNYIAYRNEPFPDQQFKPLVEQLRGSLASTVGLQRASDTEKQELYESLAIVGTQMAVTREALQKKPDEKIAAKMKAAARGYLQQLLNIDPDRMRLTDHGLLFN
jgi:hypothetical protein